MEIISVDFLSLEPSKGGFENILVVTDHFIRYAQAYPTKNQTARTTAKTLFDQFIVNYGFPSRIHSDQGPNFESTLIKELCTLGSMAKTHTTPYHAMGNGMTERFNQTLLKMLGTLEEHQKSDWKSYVGPLVHAYNATIHDSTVFSPYFLMFGRQPKLPIDALLGITVDDLQIKTRNEYVRKLRDRLAYAYAKAQESSKLKGSVDKSHYDKKVGANSLSLGNIVVARNVSVRLKHKIADAWESEPYVVVERPNKELPVYVIKRLNGSRKTKTLHRNLLLPVRWETYRKDGVRIGRKEDCNQNEKYVIPQRRKDTDSTDESGDHTRRRSKRTRREPKRYGSSGLGNGGFR